jgi:hypothetical protein
MNNLKFRVWDLVKNKMCKVKKIEWNDNKITGIWVWDEKEEFKTPQQVKLMQFTGKKDSFGKEIYESDIIETSDGVGVIFNRLGCWFVELQQELGYLNSDIKIIGNIYENKREIGGVLC